jgi:hypothetical protein
VNVGGRRDEEDVGNGNGGGGSSFSGGTSVLSVLLFRLNHEKFEVRKYVPSQTFNLRILAPLARPIALPSSLELTVKRRFNPAPSSSTSLTILLRLLGAGVGFLSSP